MADYDTNFAGWTRVYSGKVRDMYVPTAKNSGVGSDVVLMVASDRISAYDHILPTRIPDKGRILTQLSLWWFEQLSDLVSNHVLSTDVPAQVAGRAMICRRLKMVPVECVVRGYLTGSGLKEYNASGAVCGVPIPPGLMESSRLNPPIFTPAQKAPVGEHDENVTFEQMCANVGANVGERLRKLSLAVYERAARLASERGIILADTKFEFGVDQHEPDQLVLGDEVLTPDSSRFWQAETYLPGQVQASLDKQFVRDWLRSPEAGWDPNSDQAPPELPEEVVEKTRQRYIDAYEILTGRKY